GRRFKVIVKTTKGIQPSPFYDDTKSGSVATVTNLDTGKMLTYGLLVPYMIERYGFYEGRGTPYRLEPRSTLDELDYLIGKTPYARPAGLRHRARTGTPAPEE